MTWTEKEYTSFVTILSSERYVYFREILSKGEIIYKPVVKDDVRDDCSI